MMVDAVIAALEEDVSKRNAGISLPPSDLRFLDEVVSELSKPNRKMDRSKLARAIIRQFRVQWESTPIAERRRMSIEA